MKVNVLVLVENRAFHALGKEHGLALIVESEEIRILFDSGASSLLWRNAEALGKIESMKRLDGIVISHGHYDHAGGLPHVLKRQERSVPVHVGRGFFQRKIKRSRAKLQYIGPPEGLDEFEGSDRAHHLIEEKAPREIGPGFIVTGEIPLKEDWEEGDGELCLEGENGILLPDPFLEERVLAVRTGKGILVFVGCAHRGFVNSIAAARAAAGDERVRAVFGGAHLWKADDERIGRTAKWVAALDPEGVALGHCTGAKAEKHFAEVLGKRFQSLRGGMEWEFA